MTVKNRHAQFNIPGHTEAEIEGILDDALKEAGVEIQPVHTEFEKKTPHAEILDFGMRLHETRQSEAA